MTNLKRIEWHGGSSAHVRQQHLRQRNLVEASLLRCAPVSRRWDERNGVEYRSRAT